MSAARRIKDDPARLRSCLHALAAHTGLEVLRVAIAIEGDPPSMVMHITHSLGAEHEVELGPPLIAAFAEAYGAIIKDNKEPET